MTVTAARVNAHFDFGRTAGARDVAQPTPSTAPVTTGHTEPFVPQGPAFPAPPTRFDPGNGLARAERVVANGGDPTPALTIAVATYGHSVRQVYVPRNPMLAKGLNELLEAGYVEFKSFGADRFQARVPDGLPNAGSWETFSSSTGRKLQPIDFLRF